MASIRCSAVTAEVALDTAAKTVLQVVAATNQRVKVTRWGVFFDGVSSTDAPVLVQLLRQTTAGTMSSLTPVKEDNLGSESLQTTAQHTASVEPTDSDVIRRRNVHPQSGYLEIFPLGQELIIPGGGRLAVKCTAGAAVNVVAEIGYEE